jgi:hypothetical protein
MAPPEYRQEPFGGNRGAMVKIPVRHFGFTGEESGVFPEGEVYFVIHP